MTWSNAFDIGPCNVTVDVVGGSSHVWSGLLAKGASSPPVTAINGDVVQASVTSGGDVVLTWLSGTGGSPRIGYQLSVIPTYNIASVGLRVSGISMPQGISGVAQAFSSESALTQVTLSSAGGNVWTPDPADISSETPHDGLYIFEGSGV